MPWCSKEVAAMPKLWREFFSVVSPNALRRLKMEGPMPLSNDRTLHRPKARKKQLLVEPADLGLVVYDLDRHDAHSLNGAAATIWKSCDGRRTVEEIADRLDLDLEPNARVTL